MTDYCDGIKTISGTAFGSNEQREHFNKLKTQVMSGLEQFIHDPEFSKMPFFRQYKNFHEWRKYDIVAGYNQVHPMCLYLENYFAFQKYIEKVDFEAKSKYACGDYTQQQLDETLCEIERRKLLVESEIFIEKKQELKNTYTKDEINVITKRLGYSIEQFIKDTCKSRREELFDKDKDAAVLI